jgi:hypothetical protein
MTGPRHLTEAERHGIADGTLTSELEPVVAEHLGACTACAADVARIRTLMTHTHEAPSELIDPGDDLWPSIRARIEQEKIAPLREHAATRAVRRPRLAWVGAGIAAAAVIATVALVRRGNPPAAFDAPASSTNLRAVAETTQVYEEQVRFLLNQLELRRALMRPQTAASIDHDLEVIDDAIAELKRAIDRDPRNVALRVLLASSYKQKVELLKRVGNAG